MAAGLIVFAVLCYSASYFLCARSAGARRLDWRVLALALIILNALDLLTTRVAFTMGGEEANAVINRFVLPLGETALVLHKLLIAGAIFLVIARLSEKSIRARRLAIASTIALALTVFWNALNVLVALLVIWFVA